MFLRSSRSVTLALLVLAAGACAKKPPVVAAVPATAPTVVPGATDTSSPAVTPRPPDPPAIGLEPSVRSSPLGTDFSSTSDEELNGPNSPLEPALFAYDSDELDAEAKKILTANAEVLRKYRTWVVTVEGHCDERGSAEYNLALGDRRALAAKNFLVSLGIASDRLRTVSYGKEFPFDQGHDEGAWTRNRRAHFMVTAK